MKGRLIDKDVFMEYDLLLLSAGGSGCTTIHKEIDKHAVAKNCIADTDGLKHLSSPRQNIYLMNRFTNIIYLYNDPLLSIVSHYRRGWHIMQHKKLVQSDYLSINKISTFKKFQASTISAGKDIFGIEEHFKQWANLAYSGEASIYFCDFRHSAEVISLVKDTLKVNIDYKLTARSQETQMIYKNVHPKVKEIYSSLDRKLVNEIEMLKLFRP